MSVNIKPFDLSAKDTKDSLTSVYADQRENSLQLASTIVQGLYRHEMKRINEKLYEMAHAGGYESVIVTQSDIDEMITQLMQVRRHIADADKSGAVLQALKQIKL